MNLTELINECIRIKPGDKEFALFFNGDSEWTADIGNEYQSVGLGEVDGEFSEPGATPEEAVSNLLKALRGVAEVADAIATKVQEPAWTGTGLPPVGTVCERCWCSISDTYHRIKVLGHDGNSAIFRWLDGERAGELQEDRPHSFSNGRPCFRPIPTPEQIAAEERKAEIKEMAGVVSAAAAEWKTSIDADVAIRALHAAGYRKTEAP